MNQASEMNFKDWDEKPLKGKYRVTVKVDGVRVTNKNGVATSRNDNPLFNIPVRFLKPGCWYEVFAGTFKETISIVRASKSERREIREDELFMLSPTHDPRIELCTIENPTADQIKALFKKVKKQGHEGLVLQLVGTTNYVKVKPTYTVDLKITGFVEGNGRLKGKLGKLCTAQGDVGTGFSDEEREKIWKDRHNIVGTYVEVKAMEKTPNGKFRHPRFLRMRPDK